MLRRLWRNRMWRSLIVSMLVLAIFGAGYVTGFLTFQPVLSWISARNYKKCVATYLNKPAPLFQSTTVDGQTWRLEDHRGKVVVVDFTASWCAPCVGEYPILKRVYKAHSADSRVVIVGVALDEDLEALQDHLRAYEVPWVTLFEPGKGWDNSVARQYRVSGIPSIWIVDQDGLVAAMHARGATIESTVQELLEKAG